MKKTSIKSLINLILSVVVTAGLLVGWHFALPHLGEIKAMYKVISYSVLVFGMTWVLDALLSMFVKAPKGASEKTTLHFVHNVRAMIGFMAYLILAALIHAVVAVLFIDSGLGLMIDPISKSFIVFVGFTLFLQNALHTNGNKLMTLLSGILSFAAGIVCSVYMKMYLATGIMCGISLAFLLLDGIVTCKKRAISPIKFFVMQTVYMLIFFLVILVRSFVVVNLADVVAMFIANAVVNFSIAVVINAIMLDIVIIATWKALKKDKKLSK